jgi:hypothetical protein
LAAMPKWKGPRKRSDREQHFFCLLLSTPTPRGLWFFGLPSIDFYTQRSFANDFYARGCVLYCAYGIWRRSIRSILSHRQRRGVLTGGSTAARSCRHVHEEGARPYRAQRRGVLTGGSTAARSCSYVRQESAHTCQGRALWDGVMTMPMSYSNYSTSWRRFTPRWLGPNIVK